MADEKKISELPLVNAVSIDDELVMNSAGETKRGKVSSLMTGVLSDKTDNALEINNGKLYVNPLSGADIDITAIEVYPTSPPLDLDNIQWINVNGNVVKAYPTKDAKPIFVFPDELPRIILEVGQVYCANGASIRVKFITDKYKMSDNVTVDISVKDSSFTVIESKLTKINETSGYIDFAISYAYTPSPKNGTPVGTLTIFDSEKMSHTAKIIMYPSGNDIFIRQTEIKDNLIKLWVFGTGRKTWNAPEYSISRFKVEVVNDVNHRIYTSGGIDDYVITQNYDSNDINYSRPFLVSIYIDDPLYSGQIELLLKDELAGIIKTEFINYP